MFFLPLFDDNPTNRRPVISWAILAGCIFVYIWQSGLSAQQEYVLFMTRGSVPAELLGGAGLLPFGAWGDIITSMFLHGGWLHLASNMLYLWIFADNVEDAMGPVRFCIFYVLCGCAAAYTQALIAPSSPVPMVGASGAVAGLLGAYILLHPRAAVRVLFIILIFFRVISLPAWLVLGVWIGGQFVSAPASLSSESGVAYFAHIGGFCAGMLLLPLFKRKDVALFSAGTAQTQKRWSPTPIGMTELRQEARKRYSRNKPVNSSVPVYRRRRGPWDG